MRLLCLFVACTLFAVPASFASEPLLERQDLFEANKDDYAIYRIPGVVVTEKGTVLVYCEARKSTRGDWGTIDLYYRRSTDGGKTFSARQRIGPVKGEVKKNPVALSQKLAKPNEITYNNPVMIADKSGAVHLLFCVEYARCFYCKSDDDGRSFSEPVEITRTFNAFSKDYPWKVLATGPGHGIQLESGRLLVPVWLSTGTGGHAHRPSVISTIYSDDAGKTWHAGDIVCGEKEPLVNPSETVAVQRADGSVMLNIRNESAKHRRGVAVSRDGATGWSKPIFDEELLEPICMASLCRMPVPAGEKGDWLVFANPHNLEPRGKGKAKPGQSRDRKNLSIKLSKDGGDTWPINRVLDAGAAGYSDLAVGADGTVYCLYERGAAEGSAYRPMALCLARFNLAWLQAESPVKRYLYVVAPGIRNYLEFGGAGILVFDMDNNHRFVKRIATTASREEKPANIKGVCASALTRKLHFTTPKKLYCVDLVSEKTLWEKELPLGCDRMSITPNGKTLYVPSFEKDTWNVVRAEDGESLAVITTKSGAHNTVCSLDGKRMYLGGLRSPYLFIADTTAHKVVSKVGPFSGSVRPFTVNGRQSLALVCVNGLLGFEIGDIRTGKVLHKVMVTGFKQGKVKRHGCPSHGVGLTPDEKEAWVCDAANSRVHVFDMTTLPPKQTVSIALREQPGWVTFSLDGKYAYPSTGEVIDTQTKKVVALLTDEKGREVHSEKMVEIHFAGRVPVRVGDQFGVGRKK